MNLTEREIDIVLEALDTLHEKKDIALARTFGSTILSEVLEEIKQLKERFIEDA